MPFRLAGRHSDHVLMRPAVVGLVPDATTNYRDAAILAEVSVGLGEAMPGIDAARMPEGLKIQHRGW